MNKIFVDTGNEREIAQMDKEDTFSQFYYYTIGYLEAGNLLIEHTLNLPEELSEKMRSEELRLYIIPACFLYRQYLELTLKDIYIQYSNDDDETKKKAIGETSHNLKKIWKYAQKVIKNIDPESNKEKVKMLESYIFEFAEEDPSSFKYRYPITKGIKQVSPNGFKINIRNLMERMNEIEAFLASDILGQLDFYKWKNETDEYRNRYLEYYEQEQYTLALEYLEKAINNKKKWSQEHPDILTGYVEMAFLYLKINDLDNSLNYFLDSINLHEKLKVNNTSSPISLCFIFNKIGLIYKIKKEFNKAIEYYNKALSTRNINDSDKNDSYSDLARIYRNTNNRVQAEKFYNDAIKIRENIFGHDHPNTIALYEEISKFNKSVNASFI